MKILGLIPARGGSKSIPKKSVIDLGGFPMLAYSIAAGKLSTLIDRVIVSTDSSEIAEIGLKYGAEVPFLRPAEYAQDNSSDIEYIRHAIQWLLSNENESPDLIVQLRPTTPFRDPEVIDCAINCFCANTRASSLRSAHQASESPFKWFLMGEDGFFKSINGNCSNDDANLPRQSFPDVYIPNGYVDIIRVETVLEQNALYGNTMMGFVTKPCCEVDCPEDVSLLEFHLANRKSPLLEYLNANFMK